jgi:hypothetical protein
MDGIETVSGISFYSQSRNQEMRYLYPDSGHRLAGWILAKHPDGGWYSLRRATDKDIADISGAVVAAHHNADVGVTDEIRERIRSRILARPRARGRRRQTMSQENQQSEIRELRAALEKAQRDAADLQALFDLQWTRMSEATKLWREATGRHDVSPDLGDLLKWLMYRGALREKCPVCGDGGCSNCRIDLATKRIAELQLCLEPGKASAIVQGMFDLAKRKCGYRPTAEHGLTFIEEELDRRASRIDELESETVAFQSRIAELEHAVLNQAGDNHCWFDPKTAKIPPAEEFLESCRRFHGQIADQNGVLEGSCTIAQLESRSLKLELAIRSIRQYEAVEGRPDGEKVLVGLANGSTWGPSSDPNYEPYELAEAVATWLHEKCDEALA